MLFETWNSIDTIVNCKYGQIDTFFLPWMREKKLQNLAAVKDHFANKCHPLNCPICQRAFKDELGVIQHYQKSKCASTNTSNITQQISPPTLPSKDVQTDSPTVVKPFGYPMNMPDDHGSTSSLASVRPIAFEDRPIAGN